MPNAMEEGPSVSVRVANYEFKGKIIALGGWPVERWRRPRRGGCGKLR